MYMKCIGSCTTWKRPAGQPENPSFPGSDWTGSKPVRDRDTFFENIFGSGRVGDKDFGSVRVRVFFIGVSYIFFIEFRK